MHVINITLLIRNYLERDFFFFFFLLYGIQRFIIKLLFLGGATSNLPFFLCSEAANKIKNITFLLLAFFWSFLRTGRFQPSVEGEDSCETIHSGDCSPQTCDGHSLGMETLCPYFVLVFSPCIRFLHLIFLQCYDIYF